MRQDYCTDIIEGRTCSHGCVVDPMTPDPEGDLNTEAVNDRA
jgi:hypothetical protein